MYSRYEIAKGVDGMYHVWHISVPGKPGVLAASFRSSDDAHLFVDLRGTALNNNALREKLGLRTWAEV